MKQNVVMIRKMGNFEISQRTKDGMFNATSLVKEWNKKNKRVNEIAEMLKLHRDTVSYRIKELGIVATQKWWYDEYQIELIKDFERSPRTKYSTVESKINKL